MGALVWSATLPIQSLVLSGLRRVLASPGRVLGPERTCSHSDHQHPTGELLCLQHTGSENEGLVLGLYLCYPVLVICGKQTVSPAYCSRASPSAANHLSQHQAQLLLLPPPAVPSSNLSSLMSCRQKERKVAFLSCVKQECLHHCPPKEGHRGVTSL